MQKETLFVLLLQHAERLMKDNQNKEEKNEMWKTFKETFKKPRILLIVGVFCYSW